MKFLIRVNKRYIISNQQYVFHIMYQKYASALPLNFLQMQASSLSPMKLNLSSRWRFQLRNTYFNHWSSHAFLASFDLTEPFRLCHIHILGNHSIRRTMFCLFNYHIPKVGICSGCYNNPSRLNIAMKDQILSYSTFWT